jgi:16S rRNA (cytosine967-C5)-methyltransferase
VAEAVQYPRQLAVKVITRVLSDREQLDDVLAALGGELSGSQHAWLQEICSGVLRWKGRLDSVLDSLSLKKKPSGWLRKVLLLAAYQIIVQERVHAGLVVSETVSLIRKMEGEAPAKYANACLRKVSEYAERWRKVAYPPGKSGLEVTSLWASMPAWLWSRLLAQQGPEWAKEYALACLERPELWLRSKTHDWVPSRGAEKGPVPFSWKVTEGGRIAEISGFESGEFIVQDISSQTLVTEMAQVVQSNVSGPVRSLDLCASPGGKAVALAWLGIEVTATDFVQKRTGLLKETVARAAPGISVVDWKDVSYSGKDWVWVDAPCTGSGIIRRHPDVRWLRQEKDLASLMKTQETLLRDTMEKVQSGSFVSYSVCSVLAEEGPQLIERLGLSSSVIKTWFLSPQHAPYGDGFWAVLLRKN